MKLAAAVLREMAAHAEKAWPAESCGVIVGDARGALRYAPIPNIAGTLAADPISARTVRDGYVMDPKALMEALEAAEGKGGGLIAVVHSHPDVGAYFSPEDRRAALGGGEEPLWPGVSYLVLSCRAGKVDAVRLYSWDPAARDFREFMIES